MSSERSSAWTAEFSATAGFTETAKGTAPELAARAIWLRLFPASASRVPIRVSPVMREASARFGTGMPRYARLAGERLESIVGRRRRDD